MVLSHPLTKDIKSRELGTFEHLRFSFPDEISDSHVYRLLEYRLEIDRQLQEFAGSIIGYKELIDYAVGQGHRTRPMSVLLACEAVGGDWKAALPEAVAVELAHKASVIQDDKTDGDEFRGDRLTFHTRYDTARADAVRDVLVSSAFKMVAPLESKSDPVYFRKSAISQLFVNAFFHMSVGQLRDVAPVETLDIQQDDPLKANRLKTGALSELAFRVGAIAGGATDDQTSALVIYGRNIGTVFQIMNDLNNFHGAEINRAPFTDLRYRKSNYLLLLGMHRANGSQYLALRDYATKRASLTDREVDNVRALLLSLGVIQEAIDECDRLLCDGRSALECLPCSWPRTILHSVGLSDTFRRLVF